MNRAKLAAIALSAAFLLLLVASPSYAQATRTWVSGVGDDANPCSRTAPCKTFAGAISKTAAGGEIDAIDPGGFGAVTITKSITIDGGGTFASILASGTNGVVINTAGVVVILRNLSINGAGTGLNGIRFLSGTALHVENLSIQGFTQKGIDFEPTGASQLYVKDTFVRNTAGGVFIHPSAASKAMLDNVRMDQNSTFGLRADDNSTVTVRHSVSAGNLSNGFYATSSFGPTRVAIEDSFATGNGSAGIRSEGANSTVRITGVTVTGNATGLATAAGGGIISFVNNSNDGNTANGAPTSNVAQQ